MAQDTSTKQRKKPLGCCLVQSITVISLIASLIAILQFAGIKDVQDLQNLFASTTKALPLNISAPPCGFLTSGGELSAIGYSNTLSTLYSCNHADELVMQADGNLVLYEVNIAGSAIALWASNTVGIVDPYVTVQSDGNLVLYDIGGTPHWSSATQGNSGDHLAVQNDGNLVLYSASDQTLWASGTTNQV